MSARILTAREVAERYDHHPETILRWHRQGKMEGVAFRTPGGRLRFWEDRLDAWEKERATPRRGVLTATPGAARPSTVHSTALTATEDEED